MAGGLIDLPAELKLVIFESLTAAEIQQARLINRDLCAFVDINTSTMIRTIRKREYTRLENEIKDAVDYKNECFDFLPALRISTFGRVQQFNAQLFVMSHAEATHEDPGEIILEFAACIVRRLMEVHIYNHHSEYRGLISAPFRSLPLFLDLLERDTQVHFRRDKEMTKQIATMFEDVVENGLPGEIFNEDVAALGNPLTPYMVFVARNDAPVTITGIAGPTSSLMDILNIPTIPSRAVGTIAYFCDDTTFRDDVLWRWARKIWKSGGADAQLREELRGLFSCLRPPFLEMTSQARGMMDAGILETLYIH
ncbi:hypothetical protein PRZ48_003472 [Zasmidium cellare]|uniref:F-box domain-containing protein n=1 Tax=Zasmidium cellare TaxID=395010 RepID=A0ABR0EV69_ZASCE|nr:hypothetical protein PRZ48_003472 [Zasmidium cellare]